MLILQTIYIITVLHTLVWVERLVYLVYLRGWFCLTISGNSIAVDATVIPGQSNEGSADNNDVIIIYDDTASALKKQTRSAFLSGTGVGNMNSFTISDGVTSETISDGNTITFSGTANEVEVAVSATDTVTIRYLLAS